MTRSPYNDAIETGDLVPTPVRYGRHVHYTAPDDGTTLCGNQASSVAKVGWRHLPDCQACRDAWYRQRRQDD